MLSATTPTGQLALLLPAACILLAALAGCHSKTAATPENFIASLNAYFADHPDCLFPESPHFPYETTDPVKTKQMNALVAAEMLKVEEERDIHASRYTPTAAGERAAPRFCYGHRVVSSIDSFTPPAEANGFAETQVAYHYTIEDVPIWAQSAGLRAVFPAMGYATSGAATGKSTLAGTMAGWQVPE